jgi:hypothetical protein
MPYFSLIGAQTFFDRQLEATDWRVENNKLAPSQSSLCFSSARKSANESHFGRRRAPFGPRRFQHFSPRAALANWGACVCVGAHLQSFPALLITQRNTLPPTAGWIAFGEARRRPAEAIPWELKK